MYVCMYVCTYVCMYVCMYVRMYVCMDVCMYVYILYIYYIKRERQIDRESTGKINKKEEINVDENIGNKECILNPQKLIICGIEEVRVTDDF